MMITAAIHGIILAFSLIIPLGAQNVFIFNQGALHRKYISSLPAVITASICDTILITISVMGISVIILGSNIIKITLIILGIIFLVYMGRLTWLSKPATQEEAKRFSLSRQIIFAASVSLFNPHAIIDTVGVIGTNSMAYSGINKIIFTMATILVSWVWFFGLSLAGRLTVSLDKNGRLITKINKISAVIMWGVAGYLLLSLVNIQG